MCIRDRNNAVRYGKKNTTIRPSLQEVQAMITSIACENEGDSVVAEEKAQIFARGFGRMTRGFGLTLSREVPRPACDW